MLKIERSVWKQCWLFHGGLWEASKTGTLNTIVVKQSVLIKIKRACLAAPAGGSFPPNTIPDTVHASALCYCWPCYVSDVMSSLVVV